MNASGDAELQQPKLTPRLIVSVYLIAGLLWVTISDALLGAAVSDQALVTRLAIVKGWAFVLVTAFLLHRLLRRGTQLIGQSETALRASEEQFRQLAENIQEVFWMTDVDQKGLIYISPIFEKVWGRGCKSLRTWPDCWFAMMHPDDRARVRLAFQKQAEGTYDEEYRILHPDGAIRWIRDRAFPIRNEQGRVYRICGIAQDITRRIEDKQTLEHYVEERTREIERRQLVAEGLRDILAVLNSSESLSTILDFIASQARRLLSADAVAIYRLQPDDEVLTIQVEHGLEPGYVADARIPVGQSVTGQAVLRQEPVTLSDLTGSPPDDLPLDSDRLALLERLGTNYRGLIAVPLSNGDVFGSLTLYYREARQFSPEEIKLVVAFSDQAALAIENARLRDQVEKSAVAAERSRLARDLHDSVTQTLFSASLTADVLPMVWERDQVEGRKALEDLRQLTRGALAEMRALLLELRPAVLMRAKLDELLCQLAEVITGRARVPVAVNVCDRCELPPEVNVAFYRIAQEALNNVAKHAKATQIELTLDCALPRPLESAGEGSLVDVKRRDPGMVTLTIRDNGCGFKLDGISAEHLGLSIMRERAQSIGARLRIDSEPGHGTHVAVSWPARKGTNGHE